MTATTTRPNSTHKLNGRDLRVMTSDERAAAILAAFKAFFITKVGKEIARTAKEREWDAPQRRLAYDYFVHLVTPGVPAPVGIDTMVKAAVQGIFAAHAIMMVVDQRTFPGMLQQWYKKEVASRHK